MSENQLQYQPKKADDACWKEEKRVRIAKIVGIALGIMISALAALGSSAFANSDGILVEQIQTDRYQINFSSDGSIPRDRAEMIVLHQAAQTALSSGYSGFSILDRNVTSKDNKASLSIEMQIELVNPPFKNGKDGIYNANLVENNLRHVSRYAK